MTVYVDDAHVPAIRGRFTGQWSHLLGDTTAELVTFAASLGIDSTHILEPGTGYEHFEIADGKRLKAIAAGAIPITTDEAEHLCVSRATTPLPAATGRRRASSDIAPAPLQEEAPETFAPTALTPPPPSRQAPEDRVGLFLPEAVAPTYLDQLETDLVGEVSLALNAPGAAITAQLQSIRAARPPMGFWKRLFGGNAAVALEEYAWVTGLRGEVAVGKVLAKAPSGWRALHAVPVGARGSDIDHVLIGPGGVVTINTKTHPKKKVWVAEHAFLVSGAKQPYLRNSRHEAERAARILTEAVGFEVPVTPAIVLCEIDTLTVKATPDSVHVMTRRALVKWLKAQPVVLSPAHVETIYAAAHLRSTWQPVTAPSLG